MRPIIIIIMFILFYAPLTAQYSNYYSNIYIGQSKKSQNKVDVNANINQNINANININGTITEQKSITTIDYGALELANALKEKNRIQQQLFNDANEKNIAEKIVEDPLMAFEYGYPIKACLNNTKFYTKDFQKKINSEFGIKNFCINYLIPHRILFSNVGPGKFQNVSSDGVITDITFNTPTFYKDKIDGTKFEKSWSYEFYDIGKEHEVVGRNNEKLMLFLHKKELKRADVFGSQGLKSTLFTEDKFEYEIRDFYISLNNSFENAFENKVIVSFRGDKEEVDFEKLEGRRFYFRNLLQKLIATGFIDNIKIK